MAERPKIEFKDGKKIIKLHDGTVKEYKKEDIERYKQLLVKRKEDIDRQISHVDEDLTKIEQGRTL